MFDLDRLEEFDRCLQELEPAKPAMQMTSQKYATPTPAAKPQCPFQKELQSA